MNYPTPSGIGVPVKLAIAPNSSSVTFGDTVQLVCTLTDIAGTVQTAALPLTFKSSNPALVSVSGSGLCTVNTPPNGPWPEGGIVTVQCSYPFAGGGSGAGTIFAEATVTVTPQGSITAFVPTAPQTSLTDCQASIQATPNGAGWKNIPF